MKYFAVIGNPVAHSKSPLLFNSFFVRKRLNAWYSRIASINFDDALETCRLLKISGVNITMPYKKIATEKIDIVSKEANEVGGVNTLLFEKQLKGFNTDIFGAINPLKNILGSLKNKKVLVVGAGGAARAALFGLKKEGAICYIANRSVKKGLNVSKKFNAYFLLFDEVNSILPDLDAVVYTIPVKLNINISRLKKKSAFFSAIYKQHFFQDECVRNNISYIQGEEWLVEQGRVSCNLFGYQCDNKNFFLQDLQFNSPKKISLIGFMGSGKTSVGKVLAEKLNYDFIDLDYEIETGEGLAIPVIFKNYGENYFRKLEEKYLHKFLNRERIVLSTGGGILTDEKNKRLLEENFFNIFLCGDISIFYKRTENTMRPLRSDFENFKATYNAREKEYFKISQLIVNTTNKPICLVSELVFFEIGNIL